MNAIKLIIGILVLGTGVYWVIIDYYNKVTYKNGLEEKKDLYMALVFMMGFFFTMIGLISVP
jgi:hypothetical protein